MTQPPCARSVAPAVGLERQLGARGTRRQRGGGLGGHPAGADEHIERDPPHGTIVIRHRVVLHRLAVERLIKFDRTTPVPVPRRSWRHPLSQSLEPKFFGRAKPANRDVCARYSDSITIQLGAVLQYACQDQVGRSVRP